MDTDDLRARKEAADQLPSTPPPEATEVIDGDEEFKHWKAEIDRKHAEKEDGYVLALEADAGGVRDRMETGQLKPKRVPRVELG